MRQILKSPTQNWEADYTVFETNVYQTEGYISCDNVPYSIGVALPFRAEQYTKEISKEFVVVFYVCMAQCLEGFTVSRVLEKTPCTEQIKISLQYY